MSLILYMLIAAVELSNETDIFLPLLSWVTFFPPGSNRGYPPPLISERRR